MTQKPQLSTDALVARGFVFACDWQLVEGQLKQSASVPSEPGVYAFAVEGTVQYIGLASVGLAKRLYFYSRPGSTQTTNIRLNALLRQLCHGDSSVAVYVATPPDFNWNGWTIRGAEGLEAGLIKEYLLPWNVRGATKVSSKRITNASPLRAKPSAVRPSGTIEHKGKYGPLRSHLESAASDRISMTFAQIEGLVGKLPKSAALHQAWWANHQGNVQAKAWMGAKFTVEANPGGRSVVFRRFRN